MPRPPNILLLFTDQQRFDTFRAAGNPVIRTPNLDRLAAEGTRFTSAYSPSPVCVPARCSLIFGQYPARTNCVDNRDPMPTDRTNLMQALADAGYRTHGIGKMHFTPDDQALRGFHSRERQEELPDRIEDDDYLTFLHAEGFGHVIDPLGQRGEMYYVPQPAQMPARLHPTQWVGDRAVEFIRGADPSQPWFLWASFIHPHPPFTPPAPWHKLYRAALMPLPHVPHQSEALHLSINRHQNRYKYRDHGFDWNLARCIKAYYYACISFIDFQVGRLMRALAERGQLDDTLVLFTSDHGEYLGDYQCFGKRGMHDAAARIPLVVRYPASFPCGARCDPPVSLVDVLPTLLTLSRSHASVPGLDGVDLSEVAAGRHAERTVFSQYQREGRGVYLALDRRWKCFYSAPDRREFLFDRLEDPTETRNRAGLVFCREPLDAMRSRLLDFLRAHRSSALDGDRWREFPPPSPTPDPDAHLLIQDPPWSKSFAGIPGYTE
jgi:arylsulfatase